MSKSPILPLVVAGLCLAAIPTLAAGSQPVSPAGVASSDCPTFSWSVTPGAAGYELVVYALSAEGDVAGAPLVSARVPGGASSWTVPGGSCLAAGSRYAWTLRSLGEEGSGSWSEPILFEVAAAPSAGEVEAAIATLRRYLAEAREDESPAPELPGGAGPAGPGRALEAGTSAASPGSGLSGQRLTSQFGESIQSVSAASAPSLGTPSLAVDANVALGANSNVFKDGAVFLWDDTSGNLALGANALSSATGTATNNTAVGRNALASTISGAGTYDFLQGSMNTAVGDNVLVDNTTGAANTAVGTFALANNTGSPQLRVGHSGMAYGRRGSRPPPPTPRLPPLPQARLRGYGGDVKG